VCVARWLVAETTFYGAINVNKKYLIGALALAAAASVHAESFFQVEAGIGGAHITDMGDGVWIQRGAPNNHETQNTPAFMVGITGELYRHDAWDVRYHLDYVYIGEFSASVDGVPDDNYNAFTHQVHDLPAGYRYSKFNGHGHVQGVPLTFDVGYTWRGYRFGAEVGGWAYAQTWRETVYNTGSGFDGDLSHKPKMQFGYVVGASVSRGPLSISYRYYQIRQDWSTNPGLATGAHVAMATYRF
jgi:hypothetical protein